MHIYRESNNIDDTEHSVSPRNPGDPKTIYPSQTFQLVHEQEQGVYRAEVYYPDHSRSFKELERQLW